MNQISSGAAAPFRITLGAMLGVVPLLWGTQGAQPALAQDPKLEIRYEPKGKPVGGELLLRPNVQQPVYVSVVNPGQKAKTVTVELWANGAAVAGTAAKYTLKGGATEKVQFGKPSKDLKEWKPVTGGPPFDFEIRLTDTGGPNPKLLQTVKATRLMLPHQYVKAKSSYDYQSGVLTVTVNPDKTYFVGPECLIQLVLPKDRLPDFVLPGASEKEVPLTKSDEDQELYVKNLKFKSRDEAELGYIYLTVDGCPRAFVFRHDLSDKEAADPGVPDDSRVGVISAPYILKGSKPNIRFQVDYTQAGSAPDPDQVTVEVTLYDTLKPKPKRRFQKRLPRGHRAETLSFIPAGPDGALYFNSTVRDWTLADLKLEKFTDREGIRYLEVRLVDQGGKVIQNEKEEDLAAVRRIEFVEKMPQLVEFVSPPEKAWYGQEVQLKVQATSEEFKLSKVYLLVGELPEDNKPPKTAVAGQLSLDEDGIWTGTVTMPADLTKKTTVVGVLAEGAFADGVPLIGKEAYKVTLFPKPPPQALKGTIRGRVTMGRLAQPNCVVGLFLVKNNMVTELKPTKTNKKGEFVFTDLEPGKYRLSTFKPDDKKSKADADVEVTLDKPTLVTLNVSRVPKKVKKP
jgi:hypothetical protein